MKNSKIYRVVSVVCVVIIIGLSVVTYRVYNNYKNVNEQLANDNIYNWYHMIQMTVKIENQVKTLEDLRELYLYQNTVLYTVGDKLKPSFSGELSPKHYRFLNIYYNQFMSDLSRIDFAKNNSQDFQKESLDLYLSMRTKIYKKFAILLLATQMKIHIINISYYKLIQR